MKKILICILCLMSISSWAASCADGKGWIVEGRDQKTSYCISSVSMNWWSAFAWCASIGGELFDVNKECTKDIVRDSSRCGSGTDSCPNVCGRFSDRCWTVNTIDNDTVVQIYGWSGTGTSNIVNGKKVSLNRTICVIPKE